MFKLHGAQNYARLAGIMSLTLNNDQVLSRLRSALADVYGERIERILLFGSRARGDARAGSDYDVAVFLRDMPNRMVEMNRLADISTDLLYELGSVVHAIPYRAEAYQERTPLMHEIRLDGVEL